MTGALSLLLESGGYRVSVAHDIRAALGSGRTDPPALTLLDITLPDGDGLTLVEPLHAAGCERVVAFTGHDDPETRARCLAAGCSDVLVKPVPARELLARAKAWLG